MAEGERDPYTGRMTTGHEWNGIKELTTPVPRLVLFFLAATFISSLIIWVLAPTWPLGATYTKGLLNIDQRETLEKSLEKSAAITADWRRDVETGEFASLAADPAKMALIRDHGARLFGDNCAMCHGNDARGGDGFPSLVDDQWLWGGDADTIMETLRVGINSGHPESRFSEMLAYGRLGMLTLEQRRLLAHYVHGLSSGGGENNEGAELFAQQCVSCHGADGAGMQTVGAPNLTDDFWLYGGEFDDIALTLREGRKGVMPYWEDRLSVADRKVLTLYLLDLGRNEPQGSAP